MNAILRELHTERNSESPCGYVCMAPRDQVRARGFLGVDQRVLNSKVVLFVDGFNLYHSIDNTPFNRYKNLSSQSTRPHGRVS
jgi:hypothetical protein